MTFAIYFYIFNRITARSAEVTAALTKWPRIVRTARTSRLARQKAPTYLPDVPVAPANPRIDACNGAISLGTRRSATETEQRKTAANRRPAVWPVVVDSESELGTFEHYQVRPARPSRFHT